MYRNSNDRIAEHPVSTSKYAVSTTVRQCCESKEPCTFLFALRGLYASKDSLRVSAGMGGPPLLLETCTSGVLVVASLEMLMSKSKNSIGFSFRFAEGVIFSAKVDGAKCSTGSRREVRLSEGAQVGGGDQSMCR